MMRDNGLFQKQKDRAGPKNKSRWTVPKTRADGRSPKKRRGRHQSLIDFFVTLFFPESVGVPRLERGTSCSQSRCANQLCYTPMDFTTAKVVLILYKTNLRDLEPLLFNPPRGLFKVVVVPTQPPQSGTAVVHPNPAVYSK